LTGQTNKVIVGQQMNLKCQLMISNEVITVFPLTNFQWTVPGFAISNYVVAADASSAVVYTNFPTTKSNVVFYWVDGASNRAVQCSRRRKARHSRRKRRLTCSGRLQPLKLLNPEW